MVLSCGFISFALNSTVDLGVYLISVESLNEDKEESLNEDKDG